MLHPPLNYNGNLSVMLCSNEMYDWNEIDVIHDPNAIHGSNVSGYTKLNYGIDVIHVIHENYVLHMHLLPT